MHIIECGSIRRVSRITESTGSPELDDDRLPLEGHRRFGALGMANPLRDLTCWLLKPSSTNRKSCHTPFVVFGHGQESDHTRRQRHQESSYE